MSTLIGQNVLLLSVSEPIHMLLVEMQICATSLCFCMIFKNMGLTRLVHRIFKNTVLLMGSLCFITSTPPAGSSPVEQLNNTTLLENKR